MSSCKRDHHLGTVQLFDKKIQFELKFKLYSIAHALEPFPRDIENTFFFGLLERKKGRKEEEEGFPKTTTFHKCSSFSLSEISSSQQQIS